MIWIRIRIKVKSGIRINVKSGIRINVKSGIRNTGCDFDIGSQTL
jgi:hypothetical protein